MRNVTSGKIFTVFNSAISRGVAFRMISGFLFRIRQESEDGRPPGQGFGHLSHEDDVLGTG